MEDFRGFSYREDKGKEDVAARGIATKTGVSFESSRLRVLETRRLDESSLEGVHAGRKKDETENRFRRAAAASGIFDSQRKVRGNRSDKADP